MNRPDDELQSRFDQLRAGDRARRPEFRALLDRAESGARSPRPTRPAVLWTVAAAAAIVLAVGIAIQRGGRDSARIPPDASASAAPAAFAGPRHWTSPTATLLRTPGREVLAPPSILSSVLDGITRMPVQPKGD
jgi:hypothetical protein